MAAPNSNVNRNTAGTNVPAGFVGRVAQGWQTIKGVLGWMGPQQPVAQTAPPGTGARTFQYTPGYNLTTNQRTEPLSFATLKLLARNCDLVTLAIETRKDQVVSLDWEFRVEGQEKRAKTVDPRIEELKKFWVMPDKDAQLPFKLWLRKLLDDVLIIDQPVLHLEKNRGGKPYCFTIIDGQTIKPLLSESGKPPRPEEGPAYQQWLYGSAAGAWTTDEMIVMARNPRPDKIYGYSPVEQIYITANIAIRRQLKKLAGYTDGNIPESMVPVPEGWGPEQIAQFQLYFDALQMDNYAEQRKMRFVPAGMDKAIFPNDPKSDDVNGYDEYLARVVSYAFSLPNTWAVKAVNRATAEQVADSADEEGIGPLVEYLKILFKVLIFKGWGYTDIELVPKPGREVDPLKSAQVDEIRTRSGHLSVDEVREGLGEAPIGQGPAVLTAMGLVPIGKDAEEKAAKLAEAEPKAPVVTEAEKLAKAASKKKIKMLPMTGHQKAEKHLTSQLTKFLAKQGRELGPKLAKEFAKAKKINLEDWDTLVLVFKPQLEAVAKRAALQALAQLEITDEVSVESVSEEALAFASERAAELVGKKFVDGKLVNNPNAEWAITDSTRDMLQDSIKAGVEDGLSTDALAQVLEDSYAFSAERAAAIARTELAYAHTQGNLASWKSSGVVDGKQSLLSSEHTGEDECNDAAEDGVIPIDEAFSTGDDGPPYHTNCLLPGTKTTSFGTNTFFRRGYSGKTITIRCQGTDDLSVTPNHPILTQRGWVKASELVKTDKLFHSEFPSIAIKFANPNNEYIESVIEQIPSALTRDIHMPRLRVPVTTKDFHGDVSAEQEIDVVFSDSLFSGNRDDSETDRFFLKILLGIRKFGRVSFSCPSAHFEALETYLASSSCDIRVLGSELSLFRCEGFGVNRPSDRVRPDWQSQPVKSFTNTGAVASSLLSNINARFSSHIKTVEILDLIIGEFSGHVYNLETVEGWYFANGIVTHNCECALLAIVSPREDSESNNES